MEEYCLTHPYEKKPSSSRESLGYIIVDDINKILYCTIPKVGTTTWKKVFLELREKKEKKVTKSMKFNVMRFF